MRPAARPTVPALLGGLLIGVLSALPIVSAANACCCLWIVAGGLSAAYLLQERSPGPILVSDGAVVGLLAGVVGAFVYVAVALPVHFIVSPLQRRLVERLLWGATGVPPEVRDVIASVGTGLGGVAVGFILMLVAGVFFASAGGALGALLFRRTPPGASAAPGRPPQPPEPPSGGLPTPSA